MLIETSPVQKKVVSIELPLFAKDQQTLFYVNKKETVIKVSAFASGTFMIEVAPKGVFMHSAELSHAAGSENIRPQDFWNVLDKALKQIQSEVYIDRGNLFDK